MAEVHHVRDRSFDAILSRYSIRWLVSICDTYADYGNETQSRNALLISNFVNLLRLTETTHFISGPVRDTIVEKTRNHPVLLFDGVCTFAIDRQDVFLNLAKRMERALEDDAMFLAIWREIIGRLGRYDCAITRFRDMSRMPERYFSELATQLPDNYGVI